MTIHPQATYGVARLRHAESVARADRLVRAQGSGLPRTGEGAGTSRIARMARLVAGDRRPDRARAPCPASENAVGAHRSLSQTIPRHGHGEALGPPSGGPSHLAL